MNFLEIESRIEDLSIGKTKEHLGFTIGTITSYDRDTDYYLTPIRDSHRISYTGVIVRNVETAIEIARRDGINLLRTLGHEHLDRHITTLARARKR